MYIHKEPALFRKLVDICLNLWHVANIKIYTTNALPGHLATKTILYIYIYTYIHIHINIEQQKT